MKLLIKLALLGLIVNGAYQVGSAYATHYQFRDDVEQVVKFGGNKDDAWIHERVAALAEQYGVPVGDKAIEINSEGSHTLITIYYVRQISIVPGVKRDWPFNMHIEALRLR